jgi:putative ABC transport system permease protein
MNFLKRAFLSVTKRKTKTLILVLVMGIIANLVLAGLAIRSGAHQATELARKRLGGAVTLQADYDKIMAQLRETATEGRGIRRPSLPPLTVEMGEMLKGLEYVAAYNYTNTSFAMANDFIAVEFEDEDTENPDGGNNSFNPGGGRGQIPGMGGLASADVSLQGVLYSELMTEFSEGNSWLIEGRHLGMDDVGQNVVVIERTLAEQNSLTLGSAITVSSIDEETVLELEIVGIYEAAVDAGSNNMMNFRVMSPYNKIYVPYTVVFNVGSLTNLVNGEVSETLDSIVYYVNDPLNIESFKTAAEKTDIDFDIYKLDANDALFQQLIGPIENVSAFSNTIVLIVTLTGAIILALIVVLSLKDRKYEIGVLLSLGESRMKIIGQLIVETALVAVIAFSISSLTGRVVAQRVGDDLLKREVAVVAQQEAERNQRGGFGMGQMRGGIRIGPGGIINTSSEKPIDSIDVSVTVNELQRLALLGILIVLASAAAPTASVLRFNPKTILTRND